MDHAVGIDEIERVVVERQRLGIVMDEAAGQSPQPEVLLGELEVPLGQIHVGDDRAVLANCARSVPMPPPISSTSSPACAANSITSGIHGA